MQTIRRINPEDTYGLRHEILRPHQALEQCKYPGDFDAKAAHFGAYVSEEIVGILTIYRDQNDQINELDSWRLRAMATKENVRGQGLGLRLLEASERYAVSQGARCIWANARLIAVSFYEQAGYLVQGSEFDIPEIGPHYVVCKNVA